MLRAAVRNQTEIGKRAKACCTPHRPCLPAMPYLLVFCECMVCSVSAQLVCAIVSQQHSARAPHRPP